MTWNPKIDSSHKELGKIYWLVVPYTRGKVLDLGSGPTRWFGHWTTLDSGADFKGQRVADITADAFKRLPFEDATWDAVVASHVIEHAADYAKALAEWWRVVKPGGNLVLYWPHPDHYPRVGQPGANPDHKVDLTPQMVHGAMAALGGWDLVEDETRTGGEEYSQFQVYTKRGGGEQRIIPWRKPTKSALVSRYGGFGDAIVAASVLPGLKAAGYTVTMNTSERGADVLKHDPNIDRWMLQDTDQVPNENLGEYWSALRERYDYIVNLNGSVEGTLLTLPGATEDERPEPVRRKMLDKNYLEVTHDLAGVPHDFAPRFYATDVERDRVARLIGDAPRPWVLWIIAGSSPHKMWPYLPQMAVRFLYDFEGTLILAGDPGHNKIEDLCADAANLYRDARPGEPNRILRTTGWPIRGTMTLAQMADVVVGPETGVLNAVCIEDVPKVVFLSHSSRENLTKHWRNTIALASEAPCYPCHRMHYDWSRCYQDAKTEAAICQAAITPKIAVSALRQALSLRAGAPAVEAPEIAPADVTFAPAPPEVVRKRRGNGRAEEASP